MKLQTLTKAIAREQALRGYDKGRRKRKLIVDCASKLFAARGYDGTSMEAIESASRGTEGFGLCPLQEKA